MTPELDSKTAEFDDYAASYDQLLADPLRTSFSEDPLHFHRRKWHLIKGILRRQGVDPGQQRWLDVGCGQGDLLELAGDGFAWAVGCDPSAGMLSEGRQFNVVKQPSMVKLPFDDNSIDFVTAVCVYHHVHGVSRRLLTDEIARVLAPGGLCCIIEHNPWNPITRRIVKRCPVDVDADLLGARRTGCLLSVSGLSVVSTDYFLFFPERVFNQFGQAEEVLRKVPLGGQYCVTARKFAIGGMVGREGLGPSGGGASSRALPRRTTS